jgi:hypothetical protein
MHARIGMPSAPNRQVETRVGSLQGILSFETAHYLQSDSKFRLEVSKS